MATLSSSSSVTVTSCSSVWHSGSTAGCFVSYLILIYHTSRRASVSGRNRKKQKKNEDRKIETTRKSRERRTRMYQQTRDQQLIINSSVSIRGRSASLCSSLCPQLPGVALNGCLSWTPTSKCQNKSLSVFKRSGLFNLIDLDLEFIQQSLLFNYGHGVTASL